MNFTNHPLKIYGMQLSNRRSSFISGVILYCNLKVHKPTPAKD